MVSRLHKRAGFLSDSFCFFKLYGCGVRRFRRVFERLFFSDFISQGFIDCFFFSLVKNPNERADLKFLMVSYSAIYCVGALSMSWRGATWPDPAWAQTLRNTRYNSNSLRTPEIFIIPLTACLELVNKIYPSSLSYRSRRLYCVVYNSLLTFWALANPSSC